MTSAADRLLLLYLGGLAGIALLRHPDPHGILLLAGILAAAIFAMARWGRRSKLGRVLHDFFPIVGIIYVFELNGPLVGTVNTSRWDGFFANLDVALFGGLPAAWFATLGRPWWLTDLLSVAYFAYYVIPFAIGVALYAQDRKDEFHAFVFTITATFLVSYVGYYAMPTLGPRPLPHTEDEVIGGGATSEALRVFLHFAEVNRFDAFPSGHTTISLVFLKLVLRMFTRWIFSLLVEFGLMF
jgi:hypothetical protein